MATDICDKELGQLRKNRWDRAFSQNDTKGISVSEDMDRKATIVLEHLIQVRGASRPKGPNSCSLFVLISC